jgi:hypothetical protein
MRSGGDKLGGYEIETDAANGVITLRCWGVWELATGAGYDRDLRAEIAAFGGAPFHVLADVRTFPPQRPEIAAVHGELMAHATQVGMKRAASVVDSPMTQLQVRRLAAESGMPELAFHRDVASALAWLLSG